MLVKVLVENTESDKCQGEHGLCLYIEFNGKKYLVDSGSSGLFAKNASVLGVDLSDIDAAFLSHAHYDHSSGYVEFFEANTKASVYLQEAAKQKHYFKIAGPIRKYIGIPEGMLDKYNDRFTYVDGYAQIDEGVYILPHSDKYLAIRHERAVHTHMSVVIGGQTVVDDFSHEQTVIFDDGDGLICFNSCSHAGVDTVIAEVKDAFPDKKIKAFLGGFHMMGITGASSCSYKREEVQAVAHKLIDGCGARFYSGHCTGVIAYKWLEEVMGERIEAFHSGKEIVI